MGVVYRARDPVLDRDIAIKVMSASIAEDEDLRERFLMEARAAGGLQHPAIVTVFDYGETDGHPYFVMEYVKGADLSELINERHHVTLKKKLDFMIDVLSGLAYAHKKGIVHRDIKPANIRITEDDKAKLMDFGVARLASSEITKPGLVLGTPDYMAPEQVKGRDVTPATDIFSVGSVFYELLTYTKPFRGDSVQGVMYNVATADPEPLEAVNASLPVMLQTILDRAMAKDPSERYQDAEHMADDLRKARFVLTDFETAETMVLTGSFMARRTRLGGVGIWLVFGGLATAGLATAAVIMKPGNRETFRLPAVQTPETVAAPDRPAEVLTQDEPDVGAVGDSLVRPVRIQAQLARDKAVASGVPVGLLRSGDSLSREADSLARQGLFSEAVVRLTTATLEFEKAARTMKDRRNSQKLAARRRQARARISIEQIVDRLASSIESRDVQRLKEIYPALSEADERIWNRFFGSVSVLNATFEMENLVIAGRRARARVTGKYEYTSRRTGRAETRAASFQASFVERGGSWSLDRLKREGQEVN